MVSSSRLSLVVVSLDCSLRIDTTQFTSLLRSYPVMVAKISEPYLKTFLKRVRKIAKSDY
jgi:hypothetical protein